MDVLFANNYILTLLTLHFRRQFDLWFLPNSFHCTSVSCLTFKSTNCFPWQECLPVFFFLHRKCFISTQCVCDIYWFRGRLYVLFPSTLPSTRVLRSPSLPERSDIHSTRCVRVHKPVGKILWPSKYIEGCLFVGDTLLLLLPDIPGDRGWLNKLIEQVFSFNCLGLDVCFVKFNCIGRKLSKF